jgi:hypothetical protein
MVPQFQINREDFRFIKYNEEIYTYLFLKRPIGFNENKFFALTV